MSWLATGEAQNNSGGGLSPIILKTKYVQKEAGEGDPEPVGSVLLAHKAPGRGPIIAALVSSLVALTAKLHAMPIKSTLGLG